MATHEHGFVHVVEAGLNPTLAERVIDLDRGETVNQAARDIRILERGVHVVLGGGLTFTVDEVGLNRARHGRNQARRHKFGGTRPNKLYDAQNLCLERSVVSFGQAPEVVCDIDSGAARRRAERRRDYGCRGHTGESNRIGRKVVSVKGHFSLPQVITPSGPYQLPSPPLKLSVRSSVFQIATPVG